MPEMMVDGEGEGAAIRALIQRQRDGDGSCEDGVLAGLYLVSCEEGRLFSCVRECIIAGTDSLGSASL